MTLDEIKDEIRKRRKSSDKWYWEHETRDGFYGGLAQAFSEVLDLLDRLDETPTIVDQSRISP